MTREKALVCNLMSLSQKMREENEKKHMTSAVKMHNTKRRRQLRIKRGVVPPSVQ